MNKFLKDYLYNLSVIMGFLIIALSIIALLFFVGSILFKAFGLTVAIIGAIVTLILFMTAFVTAIGQY